MELRWEYAASSVLILILALTTWMAIIRSGVLRKSLPIHVGRRCAERRGDGIPLEMWLVFSNPFSVDHRLAVTVEYDSGKNMMEQLTIAPGTREYKIPEPQRVKVIRIDADGYAGMIVYV